MVRFFCDRFLSSLATLLLIITITFILMHAIPGGPFAGEKAVAPEVARNIEKHYHQGEPLGRQYVDYLKKIIRLDFGPSYKYPDRTVNDLIREGFPVSALIGLIAVLVALALGIPAGILAAVRHTGWQDNLVMLLAIVGVSMPSFIVATLLQYAFSYKLQWLPAALWGSPSHLVLPGAGLSRLAAGLFCPAGPVQYAGGIIPGLYPDGPFQGVGRGGRGFTACVKKQFDSANYCPGADVGQLAHWNVCN